MEGSGLPRTLTKCRDLHRSGWKIRRISVWLEQLYKIGKALKKKEQHAIVEIVTHQVLIGAR